LGLVASSTVPRLTRGHTFFCRQKKEAKEKATPVTRRLRRFPALLVQAGRLRNSGLRPSDSPRRLPPAASVARRLPPQHALILAGAGSGKTRVLTTRIAWLISTGQVGPHGILAVTFTNKAAKEMLARLAAMLPINTRGMWIGTFHGLCNRLLRAHHREAGCRNCSRSSIRPTSWRRSSAC
jgi:hypothetical protein